MNESFSFTYLKLDTEYRIQKKNIFFKETIPAE